MAKKDLDDAQEQLAQQRKQAELDLAMEQLARMEDAICGMTSSMQQAKAACSETKHYEKLPLSIKDGGPSRSCPDLARLRSRLGPRLSNCSRKRRPS